MTDEKTWEQRLAAWRSSGQTAREFAIGRDYTVHMLRYWARGWSSDQFARTMRLARMVRSPADTGTALAAREGDGADPRYSALACSQLPDYRPFARPLSAWRAFAWP